MSDSESSVMTSERESNATSAATSPERSEANWIGPYETKGRRGYNLTSSSFPAEHKDKVKLPSISELTGSTPSIGITPRINWGHHTMDVRSNNSPTMNQRASASPVIVDDKFKPNYIWAQVPLQNDYTVQQQVYSHHPYSPQRLNYYQYPIPSINTSASGQATGTVAAPAPAPYHMAPEVINKPAHKCHRCGTTETPEWRRGPHGVRTLCNACGLFHAKLVKRKGAALAAKEILSCRVFKGKNGRRIFIKTSNPSTTMHCETSVHPQMPLIPTAASILPPINSYHLPQLQHKN